MLNLTVWLGLQPVISSSDNLTKLGTCFVTIGYITYSIASGTGDQFNLWRHYEDKEYELSSHERFPGMHFLPHRLNQNQHFNLNDSHFRTHENIWFFTCWTLDVRQTCGLIQHKSMQWFLNQGLFSHQQNVIMTVKNIFVIYRVRFLCGLTFYTNCDTFTTLIIRILS